VGDAARALRRFGLVEMGIFVFVLLLGLVYAWRKGVLRWV
jgi:NADH-quinone oxidoreductase subunit A